MSQNNAIREHSFAPSGTPQETDADDLLGWLACRILSLPRARGRGRDAQLRLALYLAQGGYHTGAAGRGISRRKLEENADQLGLAARTVTDALRIMQDLGMVLATIERDDVRYRLNLNWESYRPPEVEP